MDALLDLDVRIFRFVNGWSHPALDILLGWSTWLGKTAVLLALAFAGMAAYEFRRAGFWKRYGGAALCLISTNLIVHFFKHVLGRPRPYDFFQGEAAEGLKFMFRESSRSFPSGHAAAVFSAAVVLNALYGGRLKILYPAAVWICVTRLYVGAHFPSDLIAGALTGSAVSFILVRLLRIKDRL